MRVRLSSRHARRQRRGLCVALTGGRNGFEYLLAYLGIRQRFHQSLKRWFERQPAAWPLLRSASGRDGRAASVLYRVAAGTYPESAPSDEAYEFIAMNRLLPKTWEQRAQELALLFREAGR